MKTTKQIFKDIKYERNDYIFKRILEYSIETTTYDENQKPIAIDYAEYKITDDDMWHAPYEVYKAWNAKNRKTEESQMIVNYYLSKHK